MVAFEAEVYLRRLGERLLDDPGQQQPGHWSALRGAGGALVVAGAIGADQAWRVIDDYRTATHIRSGKPGFVHSGPPLRRHGAESLMPRQFRVIDQEILVDEHRVLVRDLAITADGGTLRYRRYLGTPGPGEVSRLVRRPRVFPWNVAVTAPDIIDSEGYRPEVRFGGGGGQGNGYTDGELELHGTIAPEATWLELDGTQVDLHGRAARWEVGIEALENQSPLERFLWRHLAVAVPRSGVTKDLEPMIQALVAAGALQEGSPLLQDLRSVTACMPRHPLNRRGPLGGSTRSPVEPWGSLLRRLGLDDGPEWTLVLGAVAPPCDGVQFAVNSIASDRAGFEIEVEVAPNLMGSAALDELPVAWWARDELENHYLGIVTSGGGDDSRAPVTLRYWPALDPRAKRLDLLMCVESHRAVVSVSLPHGPEDSR
jgi:hypothetical protein